MTKNKRAKEHKTEFSSGLPLILVGLGVVMVFLIAWDFLNLSERSGVHLDFDWPSAVCSFLSAVAAITLGIFSIEQNRRLAMLNERSLEVAKINNGYSLIQFRDTQVVEQGGKVLRIKIYDTKNNPLKSVSVKSIKAQRMKDRWTPDDNLEIVLSNKSQTNDLKYTPASFEEKDDYYFAVLSIDFPADNLSEKDNLRLELDIDVKNALGITTAYKYYVMTWVSKKDENTIKLYNYHEFSYCKEIKA